MGLTFHGFSMDGKKMSAFVILFFDFSGLIAGILKNPQNFLAAAFLSSVQVNLSPTLVKLIAANFQLEKHRH